MSTVTHHDIHWTAESNQRFWDYYSSKPGGPETYFSNVVGDSLLRFVQRSGVKLDGEKILDYGCGPGYFLEKLARRGYDCEGLDFSPESVSSARERVSQFKDTVRIVHVRELPSELPSSAYSVVFLVETIEHLLDEQIDGTLREIHRLLQPDGLLITTTPHDEDLEKSKIACPECGCVFHKMQHVRSWSADQLAATLADYGFQKTRCVATHLRREALHSFLEGIAMRVFNMKLPNLVYIGEKR